MKASKVLNPLSLAERQEAMIVALQRLRDPQARFAWAVEKARRRGHLPDSLRVDAYRVEGCQVRLWWVPEFRAGRCEFQTDSDAATLKAMTGLLCEVASGTRPDELSEWHPVFLDQLGLLRQLAESRRATVQRVTDQIREFGRAHREDT